MKSKLITVVVIVGMLAAGMLIPLLVFGKQTESELEKEEYYTKDIIVAETIGEETDSPGEKTDVYEKKGIQQDEGWILLSSFVDDIVNINGEGQLREPYENEVSMEEADIISIQHIEALMEMEVLPGKTAEEATLTSALLYESEQNQSAYWVMDYDIGHISSIEASEMNIKVYLTASQGRIFKFIGEIPNVEGTVLNNDEIEEKLDSYFHMSDQELVRIIVQTWKDGDSQQIEFYFEPVWNIKEINFSDPKVRETIEYIDIDINKQYLRYYRKGEVVLETDVVTGTKGIQDTPEGTFEILFKAADSTLISEAWERSVDYFIPFHENIGLQSCDYREIFGGEIYDGNGSEGNVEVPVEIMKELYELAESGMIVYCH